MGVLENGITPETPVYGVLYDYILGKKKYPSFKEAKSYLISLGWRFHSSDRRWIASPPGPLSLSREGSYELWAIDVKRACVIAREYDIREVKVESFDPCHADVLLAIANEE